MRPCYAALVMAAVALVSRCAEGKPRNAGVRRNSALHAKKRRPARGGRGSAPRRKKRDAYDYDDDEEDGDDDDEYDYGRKAGRVTPYYKPRRKPTGPSMFQRAQKMAKETAAKTMEASKVAASKAKVLAAEAAVKGHEASRLAKAYYSSEYEKFLLTATWPSDARVSPQLARRLVESVARFPARPHALPDDDPYRVTLRKLWKKMVEKDWRTTTKALYLLHALSRSTPTKNARALSRTLKSMVGDADPKSGRKYFSRRELVAGKDDDDAALVDAYAGFVLRRALLFAAKFDDVAAPPKKKKTADAAAAAPAEGASSCAGIDDAVLKRAQNALLVVDHALAFADAALVGGDPRRAHLLVVSCLELVVTDVVDAWALAGSSVAALAAAVGTAPVETGDDARRAALAAVSKYSALRPRVKRTTKAALKTLRFFDLRVTANLDGAAADDAAIDAAVAAHGAAVDDDAPAAGDDDDDDDDEAEDDDEADVEEGDDEDEDEDEDVEEEDDDEDEDDEEEEEDDDDDDEDFDE